MKKGDSEIILGLIDRTPFIYEMAQVRPFRLELKSILYQTSYGFIVCALFYLPNPMQPTQIFAGFETYINVFNSSILTTHLQLSRQSHWHLFLIDADNEVVDVFEFENCYELEETLNRAIKTYEKQSAWRFYDGKARVYEYLFCG